MRIVRDAANSDLIFNVEENSTKSTLYQETTMEFRTRRGIIQTASYDIWHYYPEGNGLPENYDEEQDDKYKGSFSGSKNLTAELTINTEGWLDA